MANLRRYVAAPAFTPLPFGLLSTLGSETRSPSSDVHFGLGVTYEVICGLGASTYNKCISVTGSGLATPPLPPSKTASNTLTARGATPFAVYTEIDCSAPGFWDRAEASAEEALARVEGYQVEKTLWTGAANGVTVMFPHLAANAQVLDEDGIVLQTAAVQVTGAAILDVVEGIGALEYALANCYEGVGVIHVPRNLAPHLAFANLLVREGPRYRTPNGNIVVLGAGYAGTGPDGTLTAGSTWVYATGMPFIYRDQARVLPVGQSIDRGRNTVKAIAERTYVIGWDCCHFAVRISSGGITTGAAFGAS